MAETIVAASLLAVLLVTVLNIFPTAMTTTRLSGERYRANLLAHDTLDLVAARGFAQIPLGLIDSSTLPVSPPYSLEAEIEAVPGFSIDLLKRIRVRVSWTHRNRTRTVTQELDVQPARP